MKTLAVLCALVALTAQQESFQLHFLHISDFHARFEEIDPTNSGVCKTQPCVGGISRVYTAVTERYNPNDTIFLNAGDNFQGTLWYNVYKWNVTQHFLNKLPIDAYVLGNHEFDDKIAGVVPFMQNMKAPAVICNIDDSLQPDFQGWYNKSIVVVRGGKRIGIIGVIVSNTNVISSSQNLKFLNESESVNREAERLVAEGLVDTIVVVSHSGYDVEQFIAQNAAPKIGLVVGGHSHTFLYTGTPPSLDIVRGPYPTVVNHTDGRQILVVQALSYTKYLGELTVTYDANGDVLTWTGSPIYLDAAVLQDADVNSELLPWKNGVDAFGNVILGETKVLLNQTNCYNTECTLGNFVTDGMVFGYVDLAEGTDWTYAAIAITNPGGIRASINPGNITFNDLVVAQPFENSLDVGELLGVYIKEFLEFAASPFLHRDATGLRLLQLSGIHVVYNITESVGSRVKSVKIRCQACRVPVYSDLDPDAYYRIVLPSFLALGGDGYTMIRDNLKNRTVGPRDTDVFRPYIAKESPILQEQDGRIKLLV